MFEITALNPATNETKRFFYDAHKSTLTHQDGSDVMAVKPMGFHAIETTSAVTPTGKTSPRLLKISLGLSCNYECEYCSQRFVPRAEETNHNDIDNFIGGLDAWVKTPPEKIEFWGGEPLVYIKTMRPLAEAIRLKYPQSVLSFITNGSLLTEELNEWVESMGFAVGISHDGPGQSVRGPDPLDDPIRKAAILDLYRRLAPQGRISFNAMMNRSNKSRVAVRNFFVQLTGDENVKIGEGSLIDAYDEGGLSSSLSGSEHVEFRRNSLYEIRTSLGLNVEITRTKVENFFQSIITKRPSTSLGQKCGMDRSDSIAVDLNGNVMTCQNVSSNSTAPNGNSHLIGNVQDLGAVKLNTSTHWSHRDECSKCPVLQLCAGACMFLEGNLWDVTCDSAFSDNIVFFAAAFELMTGHIPIYINGPQRQDRRDVFGHIFGVPKQTKRPFPIPVVAG
jgi:uncharacterized protein